MGNLNPFCRAVFCASREVAEVHTYKFRNY
jgi:hypothetical protein